MTLSNILLGVSVSLPVCCVVFASIGQKGADFEQVSPDFYCRVSSANNSIHNRILLIHFFLPIVHKPNKESLLNIQTHGEHISISIIPFFFLSFKMKKLYKITWWKWHLYFWPWLCKWSKHLHALTTHTPSLWWYFCIIIWTYFHIGQWWALLSSHTHGHPLRVLWGCGVQNTINMVV